MHFRYTKDCPGKTKTESITLWKRLLSFDKIVGKEDPNEDSGVNKTGIDVNKDVNTDRRAENDVKTIIVAGVTLTVILVVVTLCCCYKKRVLKTCMLLLLILYVHYTGKN